MLYNSCCQFCTQRFSGSFSQRSITVTMVGMLVLAAIALRGYWLGSPTLWADEAESARH